MYWQHIVQPDALPQPLQLCTFWRQVLLSLLPRHSLSFTTMELQ